MSIGPFCSYQLDECIGQVRSEGLVLLGFWGGRVVRWCWVNFQSRGVLLVWIIVGQGPIALAVGAGGGCLDVFSFSYPFSPLSPSLWETARYRLKYCLKGPLNPKQPTNIQSRGVLLIWVRVGQGPIALAVGAGGDCLDTFSLVYHFSFLSPALSGRRPDID